MPGSLRYPMLPCKPSLHLRSPLSSPPPESGEDDEEEDFGTVADVGSDSTSISIITTKHEREHQFLPGFKASLDFSQRSRTAAVIVESDAPVAGPSHSTTVGASTLSANVTADGSTSTRRISSRRPGSTSTPASTSTTTPPKPKPTPATPTPNSKLLKLPPRPFKMHVDDSVVESVPGAEDEGKEVEEVLGSPMRVDTEVQVHAVCAPTQMVEVRVEAAKVEAVLVQPTEAEEADAIPASHV
ncbi:hypothetical protein DXG01_009623 [Tephrocybe rancida]|nr:hypothetical protein DXG01_009623 [Tephrocybe rancida]